MNNINDIIEVTQTNKKVFLKINVIQFKKIGKSSKCKDDIYKIILTKCNEGVTISKKFNRDKLDVILDLWDVGLLDINIFFIKELITKLQKDLPETLNEMFIINYSRKIKYIYKIISPIIDPDTRKKIMFK